MDTSSYVNRAFLRRTLAKGSSLGTRGFHCADRQRQDYRLGGLLRRTGLPARSFGFVFHGMGRTVNESARAEAADAAPTQRRIHFETVDLLHVRDGKIESQSQLKLRSVFLEDMGN